MPHGGGPIIYLRQSVEQIRYAKVWQQLLYSTGLIAGGAVLIAVGHIAGAIMVLLGLSVLAPMLRRVVKRRGRSSTRH
jgi:hypothetical protein